MDSEKTLLEEANLRVRALDGAILLAEVPETTSSIGVVEIAFDRTPSGEGSYYVVFDSERRHPYSPIDPGAPLPPEDLAVVRAAVEAAAPDEPWVRYGLDREVTPLGFRPDGEPYTAEEARPVPLGSARPAPSPYTPQADMRGVQAPAREASTRRERAELAR